jgi:hypothetical protein
VSFAEQEKFYGMDGDKVGALIDAYFIRNEVDAMEEFSARVMGAMEMVREKVLQAGGKVIFCAGDSILFQGNFDSRWCEQLLDVFLQITGRTSSMGIGDSATEAYLGLKLAKSFGGGKAVTYHLTSK